MTQPVMVSTELEQVEKAVEHQESLLIQHEQIRTQLQMLAEKQAVASAPNNTVTCSNGKPSGDLPMPKSFNGEPGC